MTYGNIKSELTAIALYLINDCMLTSKVTDKMSKSRKYIFDIKTRDRIIMSTVCGTAHLKTT